MNLLNHYHITVSHSEREPLPSPFPFLRLDAGLPGATAAAIIREISFDSEPVIPFSFSQGLADCQEGRVIDMDDALYDAPPDL